MTCEAVRGLVRGVVLVPLALIVLSVAAPAALGDARTYMGYYNCFGGRLCFLPHPLLDDTLPSCKICETPCDPDMDAVVCYEPSHIWTDQYQEATIWISDEYIQPLALIVCQDLNEDDICQPGGELDPDFFATGCGSVTVQDGQGLPGTWSPRRWTYVFPAEPEVQARECGGPGAGIRGVIGHS